VFPTPGRRPAVAPAPGPVAENFERDPPGHAGGGCAGILHHGVAPAASRAARVSLSRPAVRPSDSGRDVRLEAVQQVEGIWKNICPLRRSGPAAREVPEGEMGQHEIGWNRPRGAATGGPAPGRLVPISTIARR